eukprot:1798864-Pyramimonas_sp.AAC.1
MSALEKVGAEVCTSGRINVGPSALTPLFCQGGGRGQDPAGVAARRDWAGGPLQRRPSGAHGGRFRARL